MLLWDWNYSGEEPGLLLVWADISFGTMNLWARASSSGWWIILSAGTVTSAAKFYIAGSDLELRNRSLPMVMENWRDMIIEE